MTMSSSGASVHVVILVCESGGVWKHQSWNCSNGLVVMEEELVCRF